MLNKLIIWIMRFVLLGMIYIFLYKVIKVMYSDLKGNKIKASVSAGIEVIDIGDDCPIPIGAVYPLHSVTNIGRTPDNNIVLDCKYVSNYHARIFLKNNYYILKDMNSTNGTFLNSIKVEKPTVVKNDDLINIGGVIFKVIG
ncbi:FHA domain-containing protein FhaB [Oxobacter pfennigii]|uniref:FHA domain-containing protein FhaB n=1 Tax=Oxobacter pfennigii TaxID=36849 RepID=A0A0P8W4A7_9CLOT|nr:FHA domain-containing protein [Oxobacter pfennigii]KPU43430.1 FHA domain-containing protein FhaB [Oxobacter pfennigii]